MGRHPRGDEALAPTFRRAASADTNRPLISLADGVRAIFSHVAFDLRYGPAGAVGARGAFVHEGFSNGCTFRRCTFFFDRGDAVAGRGGQGRVVRGVPRGIAVSGAITHPAAWDSHPLSRWARFTTGGEAFHHRR